MTSECKFKGIFLVELNLLRKDFAVVKQSEGKSLINISESKQGIGHLYFVTFNKTIQILFTLTVSNSVAPVFWLQR